MMKRSLKKIADFRRGYRRISLDRVPKCVFDFEDVVPIVSDCAMESLPQSQESGASRPLRTAASRAVVDVTNTPPSKQVSVISDGPRVSYFGVHNRSRKEI